MKRWYISTLLWLCAIASFATTTVTVTSPANNATVNTTFTLKANATSTNGVDGWYVYVDGNAVWHTGSTSAIAPTITTSVGSHQITVRAWDNKSGYGTARLALNVTKQQSTMTVVSPLNGYSAEGPVTFSASATSPNGIDGWVIYVDGVNVFQNKGGQPTLNTIVNVPVGSHLAFLRAWDKVSGYVTSQNLVFTVLAPVPPPPPSNPYVVPPATATLFKQEQNNPITYWKQTTSEAGGQISTDFWTTPNVPAPSETGASRQFHISGGPWVAALWYHRLELTDAQSNAVTNILVDWDYYIDQTSQASVHTLEYDTMQVFGGYEYMIGSHCNFGTGFWSIWNQASNKWIDMQSLPCNTTLTPAGQWHHVQWHMERVPNSVNYKYDTLIVDGTVYNVNMLEPASPSTWSNNITVQWQIDVAGSGGVVDEWIDNVTVAIW